MQIRASRPRLFDQETRGAGRIDRAVTGNTKAAGEARTKVWFGVCKRPRIEDLGRNTVLFEVYFLAPHLGHLLFIRRNPDRAAGFELAVSRQLCGEFVPEDLRITGQSKLGLGIVHDNNMAHARRSRPSADDPGLDDGDTHPRAGAFRGACGADNACADNHCIVIEGSHRRIPQQNGSRSSRIKVASALTKAEPLMLG